MATAAYPTTSAIRGRVTILFGSQTGCAEEVAHRLAAEAVRRRYTPVCCSMEDYDVRALPTEALVVLIASTTGEGEVPDAMRGFWQFLLRKDLPDGSLRSVLHACFGLGDSSYPKFCFAAKRLHRRMEQLGSTALVPIGLGDDQDALGIDFALEPWLATLWSALGARLPLPAGCEELAESECPPPRYTVEVLPASCEGEGRTAEDMAAGNGDWGFVGDAPDVPTPPTPTMAAPVVPAASREHPFRARVLENTRLTASGCGRDVRHIALDVSGWGLAYEEGDALAVQPRNPMAGTRALVCSLGLDPSARVRVSLAQPHAPPLPHADWTVLELFVRRLDVYGVPRRSFFALLAYFATEPLHAEKLRELGSAAGAAERREYASLPRRTCAEVLLEFGSARPPLAYYLDLLPPLRERYFSIASSPRVHPSTVHLCVAVVRYQTMLSIPRFGVCSSYLAALEPFTPGRAIHTSYLAALEPSSAEGAAKGIAEGAAADKASPPTVEASSVEASTVEVWLRRGCIRMPRGLSSPLVMIGPGTGVAPFRAFTQARQVQRAQAAAAGEAASVGAAILYFGCRRPEADFLYAAEWAAHQAEGTLLALHTAFSRVPGQPKVYVQHAMVSPPGAAQLWTLLAHPHCHVYIAGASGAMPRDVRKALRALASEHGGLDEAAAAAWLANLEATKRLQCETW